jgi:hypothetical protein
MASKINQQIQDLNKTFDAIDGDIEALLADMVEDAAKTTTKSAKRSIKKDTEPKTAKGKGTAPNDDTGKLYSSIKYIFNQGKKEAFVYSNLDYALILETIRNRPWLRPALKRTRRSYKTRIRRNLKKALKRAAIK